jgi:hypothetical protein
MVRKSKTAVKLAAGIMPSEREMSDLRARSEYLDNLMDMATSLAIKKKASLAPSLENHVAAAEGAAIVVGHTKLKPGASGIKPINQSEYPWNKDLAASIKALCDAVDLRCEIFYRDVGGIAGAYERVRAWGAACVVELHFNAATGTAVGTETLYDSDVNAGSRAWAQRLQDEMVALYGRKGKANRGLKEVDPGDRGYESCSALDIPSALIEPFFGDNPGDAKLGQDNKQGLAEGIARAIRAQLGQ